MKFTEDTLNNWTKRSSDTEQQKIDNAINMIKNAIANHDELKEKNIEIFAQGSYPNNTNVKLNSDVDINIMLKDTFFSKYKKGKTRDDYGFVEGTNNYDTYKANVLEALQNKFGRNNVVIGNKSLKLESNSYRVDADVVPTFQFRNYYFDDKNDKDNFIEGVKFFSSGNSEVINYPKQHIQNGIAKNSNTSRIFKRLVRIFKRSLYKMGEEGISVPENISSFLLECLIYNLPNSIFNNYDLWNEKVKQAILYLWNNTNEEENCNKWVEVSGRFYLFHKERKWNCSEVNYFLQQMWNYFQYSNE